MKARIYNGIFWASIAIVLIVYCCKEWHANGCEWNVLVIMIGMYGSCLGGVWYAADQTIKEYYKEREQRERLQKK